MSLLGEFRLQDIRLRDPFVLRSEREGHYLLYGSTDADTWGESAVGLDCYLSGDLVHWTGPYPAFRPPAGFWGTRQFWAPEVYERDEGYLMLATFSDGAVRGTQALRAQHPEGPFAPIAPGPLTPRDWSCLDGTAYHDERGDWLVYCHEWTQVGDGRIVAQRVTADWSAGVGDPLVLFRASAAAWTRPVRRDTDTDIPTGYITDGPFLHRTRGGALLMLWSSAGEDGYATGISRSESGDVEGPWVHDAEPLFADDGGHPMLLRLPDGALELVIHQPNTTGAERARILDVDERDDTLVLSRRRG